MTATTSDLTPFVARNRLLRRDPRLPGGLRGRPGARVDAGPEYLGGCSNPTSSRSPAAVGSIAPRSCSSAARGPTPSKKPGVRVERMIETKNAAAGIAYYRRAELLRLRGEFAAAEEAYREASSFGWEPQPGLAQLRLAQGNRGVALAAIRRASAEITEPLKRAALLPAYVEIALDAGEIEEAHAACGELRGARRARTRARCSGAMVAHSRGAVALAAGNAHAALVALREAHQTWLDLDAPYEVARTRELLGAGVLRARRRRSSAARAGGGLRDLPEARGGARPGARRATGRRRLARPLRTGARGAAPRRRREEQPRDRRRRS